MGAHDRRRDEATIDPPDGWIDSLPLPALLTDSDGRIVAANGLALRLYALPRRGLLGRRPSDLIPPGEGLPASEIAVNGGRLVLLPADRLIETLKQQVLHLSRLASAGRQVAVVVHEINNALSGILGYSQFLLAGALDPEARRDVERVRDESLRAARVAHDLLRFGRTGPSERRPVSIEAVLRRASDLKRRDLMLRSVSLDLRVDPGLPAVIADETLLLQVVINLLANAVQGIATVRDHGTIQLRASATRRHVRVDVRDDGPGIGPELRERVFEPFFSSKASGAGTGLGLTLSRDIVRDHGGDLRVVRSRRPGACLRITLPASAAVVEPATPVPAVGPTPPIARCRIVVIDDEAAVREVVARAFAGHENHITTFADGDDALTYLEAAPAVDLIVSDVKRPGLDGLELHDRLARSRPALVRRLLFLTGDSLDGAAAPVSRTPRPRVLRKPVRIEELLAAAREIVSRPTSQPALFEAGLDAPRS